MFTPGYDEENKSKPTIVREIESTDDGLTAEQAALGLFKGSQPPSTQTSSNSEIHFFSGVQKGHFHITADLITSLFRASTRGAAPKNNWAVDGVLDFIAYVRPTAPIP